MPPVRPSAPAPRTIERAPLGAALVLVAAYIAVVLAVTAIGHLFMPTEAAPALARQDAPARLEASAQEAGHAQAH